MLSYLTKKIGAWTFPLILLPFPILAEQPHLILHFDMNKTLIASDRAGKKSAEDVISAEIADRAIGIWDETMTEPMSYAQYVKRRLLPNPQASFEIKQQQKKQIAGVLSVLKENNHPDYPQLQALYDQAMAVLSAQKTDVFPSFYKMVAFLEEKQIPYTLVIRTFGSEAPEVAHEINQQRGEGFIADFRVIKEGQLQEAQESLYDTLIHSDHHLVIQDDWVYWFNHGLDWEYGKPFPIAPQDPHYISLFFDDNAKIDPSFPQENIVYPYDALTGQPIAPKALIEQGNLVPVEMLDALCDEDYYIRAVQRALSQ